MKTCHRCRRTLANHQYERSNANKDKLAAWCKQCGNAALHELRKTNPVGTPRRSR